MNFFTSFDWSAKSIAKAIGLLFLLTIVLSIIVALATFAFRNIIAPITGFGGGYSGYAPEAAYDGARDFATSAVNKAGIISPVPNPDQGVDENAESYEVHDYSADFRPRDKQPICEKVLALKSDKEIIFESANASDESCNYTFRVPRERESEILALIKDLKPKNLSNNVYTIQRTIKDNESRLEILKKQLTEKEAALNEAQKSYEELQVLATRKQDIDNLTKLIDLKVNTIDRLAQEKITINEQLDQMAAEQARQLERIKYTTFNVYVYEERFLNLKDIADSWKQSFRQFFTDVNEILQLVSIGLLIWIFRAGLGLVALLVTVVFAKLAWVFGKKVWNWKQ